MVERNAVTFEEYKELPKDFLEMQLLNDPSVYRGIEVHHHACSVF
jgi:hypothetical protein